ncbi:NG,NG-dimethylarginine dimethylaminohydrolase [Psychroflexus torquis ATCC 700755]|uniref:arginine deiminase n=1 Tax=Psychroflexus torquis (strain ATCC 700755 / CIP 106069 / ACAM 623) TaxID=313595 RepID=K4IV43_PSYTT|nr:arginine deiminase family protein [Psychroflexus torquis]AFU69345.1 NG,NG-dimethylarginine dimethylaminohydrolase [Psychroflexus torquis ATCC 700755]
MKPQIINETSRLKSVILGVANSNGGEPDLEDAYDPKSIKHIKEGTYPEEKDMVEEIEAVAFILKKHNVEVFRPQVIKGYNQIFSRDIGFVIDNKFVFANILPDREKEIEAIDFVLDTIDDDQKIKLPEQCHIEGGDVMPHGDYIFVGTYRGEDYSSFITARTNVEAVDELQKLFPQKTVKSFNLRKSNTDPKSNALHLDCCFQPIGDNFAIIHKHGFLEEEEYNWLVNLYGKDQVFEIDAQEMYDMNSNIFSISEKVVISDVYFKRLNAWLTSKGIQVETVDYREIAKQEGLLRCSTLPLIRE